MISAPSSTGRVCQGIYHGLDAPTDTAPRFENRYPDTSFAELCAHASPATPAPITTTPIRLDMRFSAT